MPFLQYKYKHQDLLNEKILLLAKIWEGPNAPLTPSSDGPAENDGQGFQGQHELVYNSLGTTVTM